MVTPNSYVVRYPGSSGASALGGPWVVVGSNAALSALAPLIAARRRIQNVVTILRADDAKESWLDSITIPAGASGVLVVGPRRLSPRRGLPGLTLPDEAGRGVPAGWLPDIGSPLATYAQAAVRVLERTAGERPLVVLGQWEDRFVRVGLRTERWLDRHGANNPVFLWTADRISRTDMLIGLSLGPAVAIYFGHGRPRGWAGYHGVRHEHFSDSWPEPMGALLALCCENASRWRTGLSFAERLVLSGVAGGMLAAVSKTQHVDNRRWGPALCETYTDQQPETLGDLVMNAPVAKDLREHSPYRFIGDPLIPLAGTEGSTSAAANVFAPAPGEELPTW